MKTISSQQLTENPEKIWKELPKEDFFVITQDNQPMAILLPTSKKTLKEDMGEETFRRTRQVVASMRRNATRRGLDKMTLKKINTEIGVSRRERAQRALEAIGRESVRRGLDKMTLEEINAEIAEVRRGRITK